jgi:hypothetical protein
MANYTLSQTINWAKPYIQYSPLSAGTGSEPAISTASMIQSMITSAPFSWSWNRNENTTLTVTSVSQNATLNITDFGYLERASLTDSNGKVWEIKDVYNTSALSPSTTSARPQAISVFQQIPGTSVTFRLSGIPDASYTLNVTYQKNPVLFVTINDSWVIPNSMVHVYNNLFLGETLAIVEDQRSQIYRQRGVAMLLSMAEGLDAENKALFMQQYLNAGNVAGALALKTQQGIQGRAV